jgi:hypothetical protein
VPLLPASSEEAALDRAIEGASHLQLCQILRQLCSHSKTATDLTKKHLLPCPLKQEAPKQTLPRSILKKPRSASQQPSPAIKSTSDPPASSLPLTQSQSQNTSSSSKRRATPPVSILPSTHTPPKPSRSHKRKAQSQCRNCGTEYSTTATSTSTCIHHPGKREVNPDHAVWHDFDPDVSGDAWTLMEYDAFASGFQWSCCKREVGGRGCVVGRCEAVEVGEWKRGRR